jgi:hypothetical protein
VARVRLRRFLFQLSSALPWKDSFAQTFQASCCCGVEDSDPNFPEQPIAARTEVMVAFAKF